MEEDQLTTPEGMIEDTVKEQTAADKELTVS
jgi:hypothetical protein